jgi:hypothetical protein
LRWRGGLRWLVIGTDRATLEENDPENEAREEDLRIAFHKI